MSQEVTLVLLGAGFVAWTLGASWLFCWVVYRRSRRDISFRDFRAEGMRFIGLDATRREASWAVSRIAGRGEVILCQRATFAITVIGFVAVIHLALG